MHHRTVFIVDADAAVRDGVALVLSMAGLPTASFRHAEDFLRALQPDWRGCLLLALEQAQGSVSGLDLLHRLRQGGSTLPVICLTGQLDVSTAREAFLAQAVDVLRKPLDALQLLAAVERALSTPGPRVPELSPREAQVMALLVQGMPHRQIAEALGISPRTVEVHKARVLQKTGAANLVELVHRANGLGAPPTLTAAPTLPATPTTSATSAGG